MHMLGAGVPMISIKNFLGHAHLMTTERYAELTQSTVDKQIREWNQRWFPKTTTGYETKEVDVQQCNIPDFLR